ncbi:DUF4381 domain-containing protein [Vibrio mediterranei]|uniref:DUF4381 domain-containing protein n=1 Tax=Vibrio TaxID=662 RepID=UPI0004DD6045|nr:MULTISPECIES: DUF4381 domain-containing protein [Vibrio]KFA95047.1 hypothetical protein HW45_28120 [Vibrio sp. ER1A]MCG9627812.1 DUF4381 domain-containing protein [Vibrio mediterranei]
MVTLDVPQPENFGNYLLKSEGFNTIVLPDVVSLAPQTIGAKLLVLVFVLITCFVIVRCYKAWKRNAYRRTALFQLKHINDESLNGQLNYILKQTAISAFPKRARGALYGEAWRQFLNQTMNSNKAKFTAEMIQFLEREQYAGVMLNPGDIEIRQECRSMAIQWVKHHREEKSS